MKLQLTVLLIILTIYFISIIINVQTILFIYINLFGPAPKELAFSSSWFVFKKHGLYGAGRGIIHILNPFPKSSPCHTTLACIWHFHSLKTPCCFCNVVLTGNYLSQPKAHSLLFSRIHFLLLHIFRVKSLETVCFSVTSHFAHIYIHSHRYIHFCIFREKTHKMCGITWH